MYLKNKEEEINTILMELFFSGNIFPFSRDQYTQNLNFLFDENYYFIF